MMQDESDSKSETILAPCTVDDAWNYQPHLRFQPQVYYSLRLYITTYILFKYSQKGISFVLILAEDKQGS